MSVVKLLYADAKCPRCGMVWFDVNEDWLPRGDEAPDWAVCRLCGVETVYQDASRYQAVCDRCGLRVEDYGWWDGAPIRSMGPTPNEMWELSLIHI